MTDLQMGQYYLAYTKKGNAVNVFDNRVDGDYNGLKLMEHSYFENRVVGNVINYLYYNKAHVCWVGDYYDENDFYQVNCDDKTLIKSIGIRTWNDSKETRNMKTSEANYMPSSGKLLLNHTKKELIDLDDFFERCKWVEEWKGEEYECCIHPMPLLTCSANHSGGSYYGINKEDCGTWFYDTLEVVDKQDKDEWLKQGYYETDYYFKENV